MTSGPCECERKRNLLSNGLMRCEYGATCIGRNTFCRRGTNSWKKNIFSWLIAFFLDFIFFLRTLFRPILFASNFCNLFAIAKSSILLIVLIWTSDFCFMGALGLSKALTRMASLLPADSTGFTVWTLGIDRLFTLSDSLNFGLKPRSYCAARCNFSSSRAM